MFDNILVVCHGNICRSPVGEALLKKLLPTKNIQSAGLGALVGNRADSRAIEVAEKDGVEIKEHISRQITGEMIRWADVVLVMSEGQRGAIGEIVPTAIGKTMLFGQWLRNSQRSQGGMDIPDPYRKSIESFGYVHQTLVNAAEAWHKKLT